MIRFTYPGPRRALIPRLGDARVDHRLVAEVRRRRQLERHVEASKQARTFLGFSSEERSHD